MKLPRWFSLALSLFATLLLAPAEVWACACCAEHGEYRISVSKPGEHEVDLMKRMRFGALAHLFAAAAEPAEVAKGLVNPAEKYSLTGSLIGKTWNLNFRDAGNIGALNLLRPAKFVSYAADIHDGQTGGGGGPLLYKEWRFEGSVTGTGVFRAGLTTPGKYFLVFQGRGNRCDNAEDFAHWRLEVRSRKADYSFFGDFVRQNSAINKVSFGNG